MARSKITYERLAEAIEAYIDEMKEKRLAPSMAGLAVRLDTYTQRLSDILHREPDESWSEERRERQTRKAELLKKFRSYCAEALELKVQSRYPTGAIFLLKAAHGYRDRDSADDKPQVNITFHSGVPRSAEHKAEQ